MVWMRSCQKRKVSFRPPVGSPLFLHCGTLTSLHRVSFVQISSLRVDWVRSSLSSGSWEGDVRIWKIDAKVKSFSLVGKISVPGVINSLQLMSMPRFFLEDCSWASNSTQSETSTRQSLRQKELNVKPFLLVAGIGQEARLGRWLTMKEGGAKNGAMVFAFSPRTTYLSSWCTPAGFQIPMI